MYRLTHLNGNGAIYFRVNGVRVRINEIEELIVAEKLKYYEDLEEQGRLLILPCKVGDKVWITLDYDVMEARVQGISVSATGKDTILHFGGYPIVNACGSEMGRTVFLSREEAESALKNRKVLTNERF